MAYADFQFYSNVYKGTLSEAAFGRLSERATEYIDSVVTVTDITDNVKKACCAVADAWSINEQASSKSSESVDGYSVSYKNESNSTSNRLLEAIKMYLDVRSVRWV